MEMGHWVSFARIVAINCKLCRRAVAAIVTKVAESKHVGRHSGVGHVLCVR